MLKKSGIYLDANAAAPLRAASVESIFAWLQQGSSDPIFPNASSVHQAGQQARKALAQARAQVATSFGQRVLPEEIIFTSSGTEANQLAIRSVFEPLLLQGKKPHWVTTELEHSSNQEMVRWLIERGGAVSFLPTHPEGYPRVDLLSELVRPETALVSVIWVNNETGVISDILQLSQLTQSLKIPLHLDGAQAWGKLNFDLATLGAQYVSFSGHKIGALSGTGVLWVQHLYPCSAVILGSQERLRRGGTENLLGLISLGAAAASLQVAAWESQIRPLRDWLEQEIKDQISGTVIYGGGAARVANTLQLGFEGIQGSSLVQALDIAGYCVSSGSACQSGSSQPSAVLMAMGRTPAEARSAVRISMSESVTPNQLESFVRDLRLCVMRIRERREKVRDQVSGLRAGAEVIPTVRLEGEGVRL